MKNANKVHNEEKSESSGKVKTLAKALTILNCFLDQPQLGVTEIAGKLNLHKSNVSNVLATFEEMGYLEQDKATAQFRLTLKLLRFAHAISSSMGVHQYVFPVMQEIADELGEAVYFGVPDQDEVVYLSGAFPAQTVRSMLVRSMVGDHAPLYCTGIGKAILSHLPGEQWEQRVPETLERFTEHTLLEREAIFEELRNTRHRGYSIDQMEHEFGVKCVGVPVMNQYGQVVAGMSVSGPSLRFEEERIEYMASLLLSKARKLSQVM